MLSLFQVSTMDWGDISRAVIEKAPILAPFLVSILHLKISTLHPKS